MKRRIIGFHQDQERHWVAELECGHDRHVRHDPPWTNRPWVINEEGRKAVLGTMLDCTKCDSGAPKERPDLRSTPRSPTTSEPEVANGSTSAGSTRR